MLNADNISTLGFSRSSRQLQQKNNREHASMRGAAHPCEET
jgi:hypothetical protein